MYVDELIRRETFAQLDAEERARADGALGARISL
jgi:hypothetical protein